MEFDKSRVYTALNADELKAGDKVIVANTMAELRRCVEQSIDIEELKDVHGEDCLSRFIGKDGWYPLAYLVERAENCTNCGKVSCGHSGVQGLEYKSCEYYKPKTNINLCDSCKHYFADCPATPADVTFGDGVGNDNVCACDKYEQKAEKKSYEYDVPIMGQINEDGVIVERQVGECHVKFKPYTEEAKKAYENVMTKAEKHYRPFANTDELIKVWDAKIGTPKWGTDGDLTMPLIWVRDPKRPKCTYLLNGLMGNEVHWGSYIFNMQELFDNFEFLDGSPCGVEE